METIEFSEIRNFKVGGKYCLINKSFSFKNCSVIEMSSDFIYIKLNNELKIFNDTLKNIIIKKVCKKSFEIFGSYKNKECLEEFYCNPCKTIKYGHKYIDVLKMKNNLNLNFNGNLTFHVWGLWFSTKSFGLHYVLNELILNKEICLIKS